MLLCLMGPAGAGKSTLAKHLERTRPDLVARVPVDFFFVPRSPRQPIEEFLGQPFDYDWAAIDRAVAADGPQRSTPDCDFTSFQWRSPHGGLSIGRAPVLALDGMRPHPRCELLVLLEIDAPTQQRRLVDRDRRWNSSVATRTAHLASTFAAGLAEIRRPPDLVLCATDPIERNAAAVVEALGKQPTKIMSG